MGGLAQEILEHAVVVPAAVTALGAVLGTWLLGDRSVALAIAMCLGFVAGFDQIRGLELDWPRSAADKLPLGLLFGLVGAVLAARRGHVLAGTLLAVAGPVVLVAARPLADGRLSSPPLIAVAGLVLWRAIERPLSGRSRAWLLAAVALGLAGTALFARTVLLAELALACAAVLLATLIRPAPSAAALLPAGSLLVSLAVALALFSTAPAPALLLVGLIPLAPLMSRRLAPIAPLREPALVVLLPLLLAALAAGWTRWAVGPPLYFG